MIALYQQEVHALNIFKNKDNHYNRKFILIIMII